MSSKFRRRQDGSTTSVAPQTEGYVGPDGRLQIDSGPNFGTRIISDTAEHTGRWRMIQAHGNTAVIAEAESPNWTDNSQLTGLVLTQDVPLYGPFTKLRLTSGTVICYA